MQTSFTDWDSELHLVHHGIKGQKWGVRRYQNEDGTLTALGKLRADNETRELNKSLKKSISVDEKISKEWRKEKKSATQRAIEDDDYRKSIADLEAHRLNMDSDETKEWMDASLVGERVADNMMWYKYGDQQYRNIRNRIDTSEQIAKNILSKLEKNGFSIEENGKKWQSELDKESGRTERGRNAFEGKTARYTLSLLQDQKEIEKKRSKKKTTTTKN